MAASVGEVIFETFKSAKKTIYNVKFTDHHKRNEAMSGVMVCASVMLLKPKSESHR